MLGYPASDYAGHSFRAGVAAMGIEDLVIKAMGRWESAAYMSPSIAAERGCPSIILLSRGRGT